LAAKLGGRFQSHLSPSHEAESHPERGLTPVELAFGGFWLSGHRPQRTRLARFRASSGLQLQALRARPGIPRTSKASARQSPVVFLSFVNVPRCPHLDGRTYASACSRSQKDGEDLVNRQGGADDCRDELAEPSGAHRRLVKSESVARLSIAGIRFHQIVVCITRKKRACWLSSPVPTC